MWRVLASVLLLSACASLETGYHLLVAQGFHDPLILARFRTAETCEAWRRRSVIESRCVPAREFRHRGRPGH